MINRKVPPLHRLRPFWLIADVIANWYYAVRVQTGRFTR
jgi:hypothetical protein